MSNLVALGDRADSDRSATPDTARVARRVREALAEGSTPRRARDIVLAALDTYGRTADLLWVLAEVEFVDGDIVAGHDAMNEALALDSPSPESTLRQLHLLGGSGCWREALSIIRGFPESLYQEPLVRASAAELYRLCGCPAHAVVAYGTPKGLSWRSRGSQFSCWLKSGGPIRLLRRQALSWEAKALELLDEPPAHVEAISAVPELDQRHALRVRTELETYNYRMARVFFSVTAARRAAFRLLLLAVIPVWLCLLLFTWAVGVLAYPLNLPEYATVGTVTGMIPFLAGARLWFDADGRLRASRTTVAVHLTILMVVETAIAAALSNPSVDAYGWYRAITVGLWTNLLLLGCLFAGPFDVYVNRMTRRIVRNNPLLSVTDQLLITLTGLQSSPGYHGMHERRFHARLLEWAARTLSRDLLSRPSAKFLGSGDWLARRAAGWAEGVRYMQRQVLAPVPDGQAKLERFLTHEIRCLASGDLGALMWREPPPGQSRRATLQRRTLSTARTVVVAVLPFIAVLAVHSLTHYSASLFNWGRVMTGLWALLCVLLSVDPTISEKIGAAKDIADLARPPKAGT